MLRSRRICSSRCARSTTFASSCSGPSHESFQSRRVRVFVMRSHVSHTTMLSSSCFLCCTTGPYHTSYPKSTLVPNFPLMYSTSWFPTALRTYIALRWVLEWPPIPVYQSFTLSCTISSSSGTSSSFFESNDFHSSGSIFSTSCTSVRFARMLEMLAVRRVIATLAPQKRSDTSCFPKMMRSMRAAFPSFPSIRLITSGKSTMKVGWVTPRVFPIYSSCSFSSTMSVLLSSGNLSPANFWCIDFSMNCTNVVRSKAEKSSSMPLEFSSMKVTLFPPWPISFTRVPINFSIIWMFSSREASPFGLDQSNELESSVWLPCFAPFRSSLARTSSAARSTTAFIDSVGVGAMVLHEVQVGGEEEGRGRRETGWGGEGPALLRASSTRIAASLQ
eukprot:Sspe_Gene.10437::Locus_3490_Transcript_1_1_Confidence_1.000_Length_5354::g.10437::m.10437